LLESELFGHERGAFTGAVAQSPGRFQRAHRGTLFLDEIGDLPMELQPKLLRVLQDQQIDPLGSSGRSVPMDARVIAATNQNLPDLVERREFRADLYYRLNVFPIRIPPLRERVEDIGILAAHFVRRFAERQGKVISEIPAAIVRALQGYNWPGNIRELQNVVERAVVETRTTVLALPDFDARSAPASSAARTLAQVERDHILATLTDTNWTLGGWNGAAARLGLSRTTLISKMQRLGISRAAA
jgi:formate hydrogenlyase transcriptional activator